MSQHPSHTHRTGLNRRELLQVGYSLLAGASVARALPSGPAEQPSRPRRSVILVFLTGAASHLDTSAPQPAAPAESRGAFGVTRTTVPGLLLSEHLPLLAARARQYALVRTLSHKDNNHTAATHHLVTGAAQPGVRFDKPLSRDDWPCYSAGVGYLRPPEAGVPSGVHLPTFLAEGPLVWPGQHAGFLGPRFDPWQVTKDPNRRDFRVDNLRPPLGLDVTTLRDRQALLADVNRQQRQLAASAEGRRLGDQQDRAFALLTSGKVARAFDLDREPASLRDRYGRHPFGQSLLLARRLVGAGVPVVQANMGRVQNWDSHSGNFARLKGDLLPPLDRAVSALLDDLGASGLLAETLVVVAGEFGRTPKVNKDAGRDHWAACFSGLFAGAGVRGGQVIGRSDATGSYPATVAYTPDDFGATV